jgi:hypothetical protein
MNPWTIVGDIVVGLWNSHKLEKWIKGWMSLIISALITFFFVWGSSGAMFYASKVGAVAALILGFFAALVAVSVAILQIVRKVEQFRGIALFFPAAIETELRKLEAQGGTEFDPNRQKP